MTLLLGCIADDLTGATDLALTLQREGMRVVQVAGVPTPDMAVPEAEAIVVALKSRTTPAAEAIAESLASLDWLRGAGARQFFFKYCSTFDSTDDGNIGPVADALMAELGTDRSLACPAFPTNGRTVFHGHLFVGETLLSDSPMRDHPLTPMRDSNLVSVLARQSKARVELVSHAAVDAGPAAIAARFAELSGDGPMIAPMIAVVDAITDDHLRAIGTAAMDFALITGGSGVALGLPANFRDQGLLAQRDGDAGFDAPDGATVVLAGSCSQATRGQVELAAASLPHFVIDPFTLTEDPGYVAGMLDWAAPRLADGPVMLSSSADPEAVAAVQEKFGRFDAGERIEQAMGELATGLRQRGVRRFVVAGGETSGAVVGALGIRALEIGPEIDPGVPWTKSIDEAPVALALKSGNFGAPDFFAKAIGML